MSSHGKPTSSRTFFQTVARSLADLVSENASIGSPFDTSSSSTVSSLGNEADVDSEDDRVRHVHQKKKSRSRRRAATQQEVFDTSEDELERNGKRKACKTHRAHRHHEKTSPEKTKLIPGTSKTTLEHQPSSRTNLPRPASSARPKEKKHLKKRHSRHTRHGDSGSDSATSAEMVSYHSLTDLLGLNTTGLSESDSMLIKEKRRDFSKNAKEKSSDQAPSSSEPCTGSDKDKSRKTPCEQKDKAKCLLSPKSRKSPCEQKDKATCRLSPKSRKTPCEQKDKATCRLSPKDCSNSAKANTYNNKAEMCEGGHCEWTANGKEAGTKHVNVSPVLQNIVSTYDGCYDEICAEGHISFPYLAISSRGKKATVSTRYDFLKTDHHGPFQKSKTGSNDGTLDSGISNATLSHLSPPRVAESHLLTDNNLSSGCKSSNNDRKARSLHSLNARRQNEKLNKGKLKFLNESLEDFSSMEFDVLSHKRTKTPLLRKRCSDIPNGTMQNPCISSLTTEVGFAARCQYFQDLTLRKMRLQTFRELELPRQAAALRKMYEGYCRKSRANQKVNSMFKKVEDMYEYPAHLNDQLNKLNIPSLRELYEDKSEALGLRAVSKCVYARRWLTEMSPRCSRLLPCPLKQTEMDFSSDGMLASPGSKSPASVCDADKQRSDASEEVIGTKDSSDSSELPPLCVTEYSKPQTGAGSRNRSLFNKKITGNHKSNLSKRVVMRPSYVYAVNAKQIDQFNYPLMLTVGKRQADTEDYTDVPNQTIYRAVKSEATSKEQLKWSNFRTPDTPPSLVTQNSPKSIITCHITGKGSINVLSPQQVAVDLTEVSDWQFTSDTDHKNDPEEINNENSIKPSKMVSRKVLVPRLKTFADVKKESIRVQEQSAGVCRLLPHLPKAEPSDFVTNKSTKLHNMCGQAELTCSGLSSRQLQERDKRFDRGGGDSSTQSSNVTEGNTSSSTQSSNVTEGNTSSSTQSSNVTEGNTSQQKPSKNVSICLLCAAETSKTENVLIEKLGWETGGNDHKCLEQEHAMQPPEKLLTPQSEQENQKKDGHILPSSVPRTPEQVSEYNSDHCAAADSSFQHWSHSASQGNREWDQQMPSAPLPNTERVNSVKLPYENQEPLPINKLSESPTFVNKTSTSSLKCHHASFPPVKIRSELSGRKDPSQSHSGRLMKITLRIAAKKDALKSLPEQASKTQRKKVESKSSSTFNRRHRVNGQRRMDPVTLVKDKESSNEKIPKSSPKAHRTGIKKTAKTERLKTEIQWTKYDLQDGVVWYTSADNPNEIPTKVTSCESARDVDQLLTEDAPAKCAQSQAKLVAQTPKDHDKQTSGTANNKNILRFIFAMKNEESKDEINSEYQTFPEIDDSAMSENFVSSSRNDRQPLSNAPIRTENAAHAVKAPLTETESLLSTALSSPKKAEPVLNRMTTAPTRDNVILMSTLETMTREESFGGVKFDETDKNISLDVLRQAPQILNSRHNRLGLEQSEQMPVASSDQKRSKTSAADAYNQTYAFIKPLIKKVQYSSRKMQGVEERRSNVDCRAPQLPQEDEEYLEARQLAGNSSIQANEISKECSMMNPTKNLTRQDPRCVNSTVKTHQVFSANEALLQKNPLSDWLMNEGELSSGRLLLEVCGQNKKYGGCSSPNRGDEPLAFSTEQRPSTEQKHDCSDIYKTPSKSARLPEIDRQSQSTSKSFNNTETTYDETLENYSEDSHSEKSLYLLEAENSPFESANLSNNCAMTFIEDKERPFSTLTVYSIDRLLVGENPLKTDAGQGSSNSHLELNLQKDRNIHNIELRALPSSRIALNPNIQSLLEDAHYCLMSANIFQHTEDGAKDSPTFRPEDERFSSECHVEDCWLSTVQTCTALTPILNEPEFVTSETSAEPQQERVNVANEVIFGQKNLGSRVINRKLMSQPLPEVEMTCRLVLYFDSVTKRCHQPDRVDGQHGSCGKRTGLLAAELIQSADAGQDCTLFGLLSIELRGVKRKKIICLREVGAEDQGHLWPAGR